MSRLWASLFVLFGLTGPAARASVPDDGLVWAPQAVRWPVDPAQVTPAPPFVPDEIREVDGEVEVGPESGAAFFLDGLELARVRVVGGAGEPRIRQVFGGSRSSIQTGLKAIVDAGAARDADGSWRIVEPPGDGDVWIVDAEAPIRVVIEHPRTLPARLAWEDAREAILTAIDRGGPTPQVPGEPGATELVAQLEAQAAIGRDLVAAGGEGLAPAVRAWQKAAALRALDSIRPFAWPYWTVTDLSADEAGRDAPTERILRQDGDVASRARWRRVSGEEQALTFSVRGPGILRVQARAVLLPGWLVAPAPTHVRVDRDGVLAGAVTYVGRPARVTDRVDEAFPIREVLVTRDGEWAGKINEVRIPLAPGVHAYTLAVDQASLVRVSRAERKPFLAEALAGRARAETWVEVGRRALDREDGPEAALLRGLIAHVQGEPPPAPVTGLAPPLQVLAEYLLAAHGQLDPLARVDAWAEALAGTSPPWAWWLRVEIAGVLPGGVGARSLFAAADELPPPGLLAGAAVRLGTPGLYQDRPDRGLAALELAWRALPADRSVRGPYLRQFLDGATWSRITPVVFVNGDAITPPPLTWLDTAAATGGPISRASRVYYRVPAGATRSFLVDASPSDPAAPAALSLFVRSPRSAGVVSFTLDGHPFRVVPLADVERFDLAVAPGRHELSMDRVSGAEAWITGLPEQEAWRQAQDIATVRSYWRTGGPNGSVPRFEIPAPNLPVPVRVELRALDPATRPRTVVAHLRSDTGADWPITLDPGAGDPTLQPIGGEAPLSSVASVTVYPPAGTNQLWVEAPAESGLVVSMSVRRTEMEEVAVDLGERSASLDELRTLGSRLLADPRDGEALLRRADVLAQLGDTDMARQDLRRLLRLGDSARTRVGDEAIDRVAERIDATDTSRFFAPEGDLAQISGPVPLSAELVVAGDGVPAPDLVNAARAARIDGPQLAQALAEALDPRDPASAWLRGRLQHALGRDTEAALQMLSAWQQSRRWQYGLQAAAWLATTELAAGEPPPNGLGSIGYGLASELREHLEHPAVERLALLAGRRTRWDAVRSADRSGGRVLVTSEDAATPPLPQAVIREALTVAPWPSGEAQIVTAKEPAALAVTGRDPVGASVWCQPLRTGDAGGEPGCVAILIVDGVSVAQANLAPYGRAELEVPPLPPGRHDVQVAIDDPGRTNAMSVRFRPGGDPGGAAIHARRDTPGFVAFAQQPFELAVAGPATLFLEIRALAGRGGAVDVSASGPGGRLPTRAVVLDPTADRSVVVSSGPSAAVGVAEGVNVVLPTAGVWIVRVTPRSGGIALVRAAFRQEMPAPTVQRPGPMWRAIGPEAEPFAWPAVPPDAAPPAAGVAPVGWKLGTFSVAVSFGREDLEQSGADLATTHELGWSVAWRDQILPRRLWLHLEPTVHQLAGATAFGVRGDVLFRLLGPDVRLLASGQTFTQGGEVGGEGSLRVYRPFRLGNGAFLIPSVEGTARGSSLAAAPVQVVDPEVYSDYREAHPVALRPQLLYWSMPAQDFLWLASAAVVTNADVASLDSARFSVVGRGIFHPGAQPIWFEARYRPSYSFGDPDRPAPAWQHGVGASIGTWFRLGDDSGLWLSLADDLTAGAGAPLDNRVLVGARFDLTGGRALRDRLPIEEDFFDLLAGDRWGALDEDLP